MKQGKRINKLIPIFVVFLFIGTTVLSAKEGLELANNEIVTSQISSLPESFDLREYDGENFVSSVKNQNGGTCWTHGAMASIESNLMMTGKWDKVEEIEEPNLAEYHLDWWNGFNTFNNDDDQNGPGLDVHYGGDYLVTSAYCSRGDGPVRDIDGQSFGEAPPLFEESYHLYYPRDIEWYTVGDNLENIDIIKETLMTEGAIGTCMAYGATSLFNWTHCYVGSADPNHAIAIIGWDDNKGTMAQNPGAWLCKNSWGPSWGLDGYFWISYYDVHAGQHPEMGAVSFQDVEPLAYEDFYYHDYHGWRNTKVDCTEAFNRFYAKDNHKISAVSFYTAADDVNYEIRIYDDFLDNQLQNELIRSDGFIKYRGFHTIDLPGVVQLMNNDDFYVYLSLSQGGQPYDCTSEIPVLLGTLSMGTTVVSKANSGESFYMDSSGDWIDLITFDESANFCIKALVPKESDLSIDGDITLKNVKPGDTIDVEFFVENRGASFSKLDWEIISFPDWGSWSFSYSEAIDILPEDGKVAVDVTIVVPSENDKDFDGKITLVNKLSTEDTEEVQISVSTAHSQSQVDLIKFDNLLQRFEQQFLHIRDSLIKHIYGLI